MLPALDTVQTITAQTVAQLNPAWFFDCVDLLLNRNSQLLRKYV